MCLDQDNLYRALLYVYLPCSLVVLVLTYGPRSEKTCLLRFANNKYANQPVNPISLIGAFFIHLLKNIILRLATGKINFLASLNS